jgi:hypothetical protein
VDDEWTARHFPGVARAVAPNGKVYGQFPADGFQKAIDNFNARLKTPAMSDAAADFRPFDDPIPPDVSNLDLITFLFYYHDTTYMNVDRAAMDRKMFAALKPGGRAITLEFVPNEDRVTPPTAAAFSLIMLADTDAGDAYTLAEYEKMFGNAGFEKTTLQQIPDTPQQVLISEKAA